MQSHIKIKLKFKCVIGILDFERVKKQRVLLKFEAKSAEFLDYARVCKWLKKTYKEREFRLIEESLQVILDEFRQICPKASFAKIKLYKLEIMKNAKLGACLEKFY